MNLRFRWMQRLLLKFTQRKMSGLIGNSRAWNLSQWWRIDTIISNIWTLIKGRLCDNTVCWQQQKRYLNQGWTLRCTGIFFSVYEFRRCFQTKSRIINKINDYNYLKKKYVPHKSTVQRWPDSKFHMTLNAMWFKIWIHWSFVRLKFIFRMHEQTKVSNVKWKSTELTNRIECYMKTKSKNEAHELFMIGNDNDFFSISFSIFSYSAPYLYDEYEHIRFFDVSVTID